MFDAQAAWEELAETVGTREGWGTDRLLAQMRKLETKHVLAEGLLQRVMRLYPGQLQLVVINPAEVVPNGAAGAVPSPAEAGAAPATDPGGHDGRERSGDPAA